MKTLDAHSSKNDELDALREMAVAAGDQTFLANLLNENLISWFREQMAADHSTDIYDALLNEQVMAAQQAGDIKELKAALQARIEMINTYERDVESYKREGERQDRELMQAHDENDCKGARIAALEAQVQSLKIKLFDILVAAGKI